MILNPNPDQELSQNQGFLRQILHLSYTCQLNPPPGHSEILQKVRRMAKGFAIFGMVVAIILLLVFGLDLAIGIPFDRISTVADVLFVLASLSLGFLSVLTFREQT